MFKEDEFFDSSNEDLSVKETVSYQMPTLCYGTGRSTSHGLHSLTSNIHLQSHIQLRVALMTHRSLQLVYIAALPSALDSSFLSS